MRVEARGPTPSYGGHILPLVGEFGLREMVKHLSDMGEAWPVYFDPRNDKYTTFPAKGLVYLGWYGPGVGTYNLEQDTRFVMEEKRKVKLSEWLG